MARLCILLFGVASVQASLVQDEVLCSWTSSNLHHPPLSRFCDVGLLLNDLPEERERSINALANFETEFGRDHLGHWGTSAAVAIVGGVEDPLLTFAVGIARSWGLADSGFLLLLQLKGGESGSGPLAVLVGELVDAVELLEDGWTERVELDVTALLRAGEISSAVEAALEAVAVALSGWPIEDPDMTGDSVPQHQILATNTPFQALEVWENVCDERLCMELWLDNVRQLSSRHHYYYHEAMTFPALNALGPGGKRVLILGGGDGGVATHCLKFKTVEHVLNIEIDELVTNMSRRYFPSVSAGLDDPRCEMRHADGFRYVYDSVGKEEYDLMIIDFTDAPVAGLWTEEFFAAVRKLVRPGGILVQNLGTMLYKSGLAAHIRDHATVFSTVYPLSTAIPDYVSPYILAMSTDAPTDLRNIDWSFWESQRITARYYSPRVHQKMLTYSAEFCRVFTLPMSKTPSVLSPFTQVPLEISDVEEELDERIVLEKTTDLNNAVMVERSSPSCRKKGTRCLSLSVNREVVLATETLPRDEIMALPALNILGQRARRVLVLGGGTGSIAFLAMQYPHVEKIVVVEIDEDIVNVIKKYFPAQASAFGDPRTELVIDDALEWVLQQNASKFDAILVNLCREPWRPPSKTSRVPRTRRFMHQLSSLLTSDGIIVQDIGNAQTSSHSRRLLALHRATFASVWPMSFSYSAPEQDSGETLGGRYSRPPFFFALSSRTHLDVHAVDWQYWEKVHFRTLYYHAALHSVLFTLPFEFEALFDAPPKTSTLKLGQVPQILSNATVLVTALLVEGHGCNTSSLNNVSEAASLLTTMATLSGLTLLGELSHQFEPFGVTALLLLAESHVSIHTWPEHGYAALDLVSCKPIEPKAVDDIRATIQEQLQCTDVHLEVSFRGRGADQLPEARDVASTHTLREEL